MILEQYSHPKYIQWSKNVLAILAFVCSLYFLLIAISRLISNNIFEGVAEIAFSFFLLISILVGAYYFGQDVWINEEGLQIEFLWRIMKVQWVDIIETKMIWGSFGKEKNRPLIVLVNGLTPFHRVFGVLYGLSIKPGFVIFPSISNFLKLREIIQLHARR